ncbi:winged helix-turn-helix domain-containing protein [Kitasatospora aburaviensis]
MRPPGAAHRAGGHSVLAEDDVNIAVRVLQRGATPTAFGRLAQSLEALARAAGLLPEPLAEGGEGGVPASITARGPVQRAIVTDREGGLRLDVPRRPLGPAALRALTHRPAPSDDHSVLVHCRARSLALAGGTLADLRMLVRDHTATPALEWLRTARSVTGGRAPGRARGGAPHQAHLVPRRPGRRPDAPRMRAGNRTYSEVLADVTDLIARAEAAGDERWTRPSGPSDLAAVYAVAHLMLLAGTTEVTADCRRLGVLMNRSHETANQAIHRTVADGWFTVLEEADLQQGTARRITLASVHVCTADHRHVCAVTQCPERTAAPMDLRSEVTARIVVQQGDIWHRIGHHARRMLLDVEDKVVATTGELLATSPYSGPTARRHLAALAELGLIEQDKASRWRRTDRTLAQAARGARVLGRVADLAVRTIIDQAVAAWWAAHVDWSRLDRASKRRLGARPSADQGVLPGADPTARAYPQIAETTDDGRLVLRADHQRAWAIEAERLGAAGLWERAVQLQDQDQVVDPPRLHQVELAH